MNIGILSPRSDIHPGISLEFMEGLRTYLAAHELQSQVQFYSEGIDFGGVEKEVYAKAEKLLTMDGVDVLLAFVDERVLNILKPLVFVSGKLMIVVNPGANYPQNWIPQSNIIQLTLQHSFLTYLSGALASQQANKKALMASTFYDCGYLHGSAMVRNFLRLNGQITYNYINNQVYKNGIDIIQLTDFLSANDSTSTLLCIFDAWPASMFYHLLNQSARADQLHLFVSPMMLEAKALEGIGEGFKFSITGYMPWDPASDNEVNRNFMERYNKKTKKRASIFSLLGWESGMILHKMLEKYKDDYADGAVIADGLKEISFDSPRGRIQIDPDTLFFHTAPVKCSIAAGSNKIEKKVFGDYKNDWKIFSAEPAEVTSSGWTNTYLCY